MSLPGAATEIVFLPGFDGAAELRSDFIAALGEHHPARAIGYPNRKLDTLNGYARFAASQVGADSRPILVAESFSGLVAARWASRDPHVIGVVLCGAFARSPMPGVSIAASFPLLARFFILNPAGFVSRDAARRRWSEALDAAIRALDREVIAERLRLIAIEDVSAELRALRVPIVLMQFQGDLVVGNQARGELEATCGNARIVRYPGPHFAIETQPRETAAVLREPIAALFEQGPSPAAGP
jgi:pimeloyl-ACP methyl ester carboxylesterase